MMGCMSVILVCLVCSQGVTAATTVLRRRPIKEVRQEQEQQRPKPFKYAYSAGRDPNSKPDRYVEQEGTEDGVIRGTYSYLDPNWTWQVIKYEADPEGGFRILEGSTLDATHPKDTEAVARARAEHAALFANIAASHQLHQDESSLAGPQDTPAVQQKRNEHQNLYRLIAEEHRAIAEQHLKIAEDHLESNK